MKKILFLIGLVALVPLVLAGFPGTPHQFYGEVFYEGSSVNSGIVTAEINSVVIGQTNILNGKYGYNPIFFIEDVNYSFNGKLDQA